MYILNDIHHRTENISNLNFDLALSKTWLGHLSLPVILKMFTSVKNCVLGFFWCALFLLPKLAVNISH